MNENEIRVVGAAIIDKSRCLVAKRGPDRALPGLWEFPGGKVEPRETDEEALAREINEELGVKIRVGRSLGEFVHGRIRLIVYDCEIVTGTLVAREHEELRLLAASELTGLEWAPADIPFLPAVRAVLRELRHNCCAECGDEGGVSLKACKSCMQVKYCNAACQKKHWPNHKASCKKRAAEIRDEALFKDPPPKEDCYNITEIVNFANDL